MEGKLMALALAAAPLLASCATRPQLEETAATPAALQEQGSGQGMEEMMAQMMEMAAPGEGHKRLEPLVGKFRSNGTFWMDPSAPPTQSEGVATNTWVLGGRFLQQQFQGDFMGMPFEGLGYTGFNNMTEKYEGIWMDNAGTMIMPASIGTADESGKVITFRRTFVDPMTGQETTSREVTTIVDADHHTFEWYQPGPDGEEMRVMLLEYTRME